MGIAWIDDNHNKKPPYNVARCIPTWLWRMFSLSKCMTEILTGRIWFWRKYYQTQISKKTLTGFIAFWRDIRSKMKLLSIFLRYPSKTGWIFWQAVDGSDRPIKISVKIPPICKDFDGTRQNCLTCSISFYSICKVHFFSFLIKLAGS